MPVRVVVIGAGFTGTAVAVALLRRPEELSVALVERSGSFGRGIAYATPDSQHLLNVPAGSMSALADVPDDLVAWADRREHLEVGCENSRRHDSRAREAHG